MKISFKLSTNVIRPPQGSIGSTDQVLVPAETYNLANHRSRYDYDTRHTR